MFLLLFPLLAATWELPAQNPAWTTPISQLTSGPKHHFFGYIGHVKNIPWSGDGRYFVALETDFQDHMPSPTETARVVLIDTRDGNRVIPVDTTRAWNFQQGTMFYWNPQAPDTQVFFNDRDVKSNHVFTALYDVVQKRRIREFRFPEMPFGNSGVAQKGGRFLGLNYGRLARLRPVTGYPLAHDWNRETAAPANDGIFLVDVNSAKPRLLVSYRALAEAIAKVEPRITGKHLFINHTLWNRSDDRIYFYVRADFDDRAQRIDIPCTIRPDGTGLTVHRTHIGGHPEWESGNRIIGRAEDRMILYDVDRQQVVGPLASAEIFPDPGGDTALSPDGNWIVNGYRKGHENIYSILHRPSNTWRHTRGFAHEGYTSGELRVDGSPNWNRTNDQVAFPAIAPDGTRQVFVIRLLK